MNPVCAQLPTSIFEHMSALARAHDAVNLGQGFPDFGWPEAVLEKAAEAVRTGSNQYPPMRGTPELREADRDRGEQPEDESIGEEAAQHLAGLGKRRGEGKGRQRFSPGRGRRRCSGSR